MYTHDVIAAFSLIIICLILCICSLDERRCGRKELGLNERLRVLRLLDSSLTFALR